MVRIVPRSIRLPRPARVVLFLLLLVGILPMPVVVATETTDDDCVPGRHTAAVEVERFYIVPVDPTLNRFQLWEETNGIEGLQTSSAMGCGQPADRFHVEVCRQVKTCYSIPI